MKAAVRELFADDAEIALLTLPATVTSRRPVDTCALSDCESGDDGLPLAEIMTLANNSGAKNKIIILDSCHSGVAGNHALMTGVSELATGVTILTASTAEQYAMETPGGGAGVFTSLLVDALNGSAANLVGEVTPGSIYAHIDQSLGPWAQRPVFKTNVKTFVSLRTTEPPIALSDLQALTALFPSTAHQLQLDPSFEPERSGEEAGIPAPTQRTQQDSQLSRISRW